MVAIFKIIYLWLIRIVSLGLYFKRRWRVVYVMSFGNNLDLIKKIAVNLKSKRQLLVFYTSASSRSAWELSQCGIKTIPFRDGLKFAFFQLPRLLSAKLIFCDNYYAFLGGLALPGNVKIVQLWHADGAIKNFGWGDPATWQRSSSAKRRFQQVYNHFSEFVVASKAMGRIFARSYRVSPRRVRLLGNPHSDRWFNLAWIRQTRRRIYRLIPSLKGHRVILYAPTYRENRAFVPPKGLSDALQADPNSITLIKLHPVMEKQLKQIQRVLEPGARLKYALHFSTDALLTVADTLVTDYSSVAFDFSLLPNARDMFFFTFDLKQYQKSPGCQNDFMKWLPSQPILTVDQLARVLKRRQPMNFGTFNRVWNSKNDGHATSRVIRYYLKQG